MGLIEKMWRLRGTLMLPPCGLPDLALVQQGTCVDASQPFDFSVPGCLCAPTEKLHGPTANEAPLEGAQLSRPALLYSVAPRATLLHPMPL